MVHAAGRRLTSLAIPGSETEDGHGNAIAKGDGAAQRESARHFHYTSHGDSRGVVRVRGHNTGLLTRLIEQPSYLALLCVCHHIKESRVIPQKKYFNVGCDFVRDSP